MASLGTPLRGPAPPPPFVRCLAGSLQACFVQPSQAARGALRAAGATCCISAENSPGARSGTEGGGQEPSFLFAARVRRAGFPGTDSPRRVDSPAAGRRESFQELLGRGLAAAPRRAARPPQPAPPLSGSRTRSSASVERPGEEPGCAGCVRKGPKSASGEQTGRKFVLPTLCPRGCRRGKRRRRRKDRPRQGEGETLSGSASGQPEPGTPSEKSRD